jgi:hypothetical protein
MTSCVERTEDEAKWIKWQPTEIRNAKESRPVLREYTGTRRELTNCIIQSYPAMLYHCWINEMTRQQEKLDVQTFDGTTDIVVKTDFAAAAELKAQYTATCEWPTTAQQCVAIVLHSPGICRPGEERLVKTDYWRAWSSAKPSAVFHQLLMHKIGVHYKAAIPTLKKMKVKSDGSRTQYKGRKNFWAIASSHLKSHGLSQEHDFPASHHYSGPHDNAGKTPRIKMKQDEAFGNARLYNYHCCYEYCVKEIPKPSRDGDDMGTWGCNGKYFWLAFSNGEDLYKNVYEAVPKAFDVTPVTGSNELYGYRGVGTADAQSVTIAKKFMRCHCQDCRGGQGVRCPSHAEFGPWSTTVITKKAPSGQRRTRGMADDEPCQSCGSTDDGSNGDGSRDMARYSTTLHSTCSTVHLPPTTYCEQADAAVRHMRCWVAHVLPADCARRCAAWRLALS